MNTIKTFLFAVAVACLLATTNQAQDKNWVFGHNAGLVFNPNPSAMSGSIAVYTNEGCASISGPTAVQAASQK